MAGARIGDEDAARHLYRTLQPKLLNYLRALVGTTEAEDLAAETWSRIAGSLHTFNGSGNDFRAWAITIAHHRAIDHRRRRHAIPLPPYAIPDHPAGNDTARDAINAISTTTVLTLIGQLPPAQAHAILLRVIMGLDGATTARILGKRPAAIHTAAHRGSRHLARLLQ